MKIEVNMPVGLACANDSSYSIPNHIELINDKLMDVVDGKIQRLIISMPPRHGKSEIISKYFPSWYLLNYPNKRVIITAHSADFAVDRFGRPIRNIVSQFGDQFGVTLAKDSNAAHRFNTNYEGSFNAIGAGGSITGRGADLFIIDDPIKGPEDVISQRSREKMWDWFLTVPMTRLEPNAAMVIVMTRWHTDDLVGRILASEEADEWTYLTLPALDKNGEALWAERYSKEYLEKRRVTLGSYFFNAMYQQNPISNENQIYKEHWWKYYKELPSLKYVVQSWDTAFKDQEQNDYSACTTMGANDTGYYVMDVFRTKLEYPQLFKRVVAMADKYHPNLIVIEDKASGQSLIQSLKSETRLPIKAIKADSDKVLRAHIATPTIEAGKVFLPERAEWLNDFLTEMNAFPLSANDDMVDSFNQNLAVLVKYGRPVSYGKSSNPNAKYNNKFFKGMI